MSGHVLTPPAQALAAVQDSAMLCAGRTQAEHSREMGNDPDAALPFQLT